MRPGSYGRAQGMQQIAAAVIGSAAAGQVIQPEQFNPVRPTAEETAVLDAAREFYRLDGEKAARHELMDAVQRLEQVQYGTGPAPCYCGTGREHRPGEGYHCRKTEAEAR